MNLHSSQPNWYPAAVAIGLATLHFHSRWAEWRPAVLRSMKVVYALVAFYILFNLFIIVMIWYPPDHQGSINSYVTPGVSTSIIGFGVLYWIVFAKASPALGYQIEDEEEGSSYHVEAMFRIFQPFEGGFLMADFFLCFRIGGWNPMGDVQG